MKEQKKSYGFEVHGSFDIYSDDGFAITATSEEEAKAKWEKKYGIKIDRLNHFLQENGGGVAISIDIYEN